MNRDTPKSVLTENLIFGAIAFYFLWILTLALLRAGHVGTAETALCAMAVLVPTAVYSTLKDMHRAWTGQPETPQTSWQHTSKPFFFFLALTATMQWLLPA